MLSPDTTLQPVLLKGDFDPPSWWTRIAALNLELSLSQVKLVKPLYIQSLHSWLTPKEIQYVTIFYTEIRARNSNSAWAGVGFIRHALGIVQDAPAPLKRILEKAATIHYKQCSTALGTFYWQRPIVAGTFRSYQLGWRLKRARKLPLMPLFPSGGDP
jgi:hypothetical protein